MKQQSNFTYHFKKGVLVILDLNLGGKSVTNDIENVLHFIFDLEEQKIAMLGSAQPMIGTIIYRDSEGIYDGITVNADGTVRFYSLGETKNEDFAIYVAQGKIVIFDKASEVS